MYQFGKLSANVPRKLDYPYSISFTLDAGLIVCWPVTSQSNMISGAQGRWNPFMCPIEGNQRYTLYTKTFLRFIVLATCQCH